ncbi:MAG: hypothetical protein ACSHX0_07945 [Akkermansiaceae bacterium]
MSLFLGRVYLKRCDKRGNLIKEQYRNGAYSRKTYDETKGFLLEINDGTTERASDLQHLQFSWDNIEKEARKDVPFGSFVNGAFLI